MEFRSTGTPSCARSRIFRCICDALAVPQGAPSALLSPEPRGDPAMVPPDSIPWCPVQPQILRPDATLLGSWRSVMALPCLLIPVPAPGLAGWTGGRAALLLPPADRLPLNVALPICPMV